MLNPGLKVVLNKNNGTYHVQKLIIRSIVYTPIYLLYIHVLRMFETSNLTRTYKKWTSMEIQAHAMRSHLPDDCLPIYGKNQFTELHWQALHNLHWGCDTSAGIIIIHEIAFHNMISLLTHLHRVVTLYCLHHQYLRLRLDYIHVGGKEILFLVKKLKLCVL